MSGSYPVDVEVHFGHDIHSIVQSEYDAFLYGAHDMCTAMTVEIKVLHGSAQVPVFEDAFCAVAERKHLQTF